ncbi:MAG TPA: two-component regulator propeller domain-containing protein, partial [candidate division Zixibacteria bacterium]|nr:two-component regulator propeller domain-containing protein [candidate division Zixibacteria bacterium]
MASSKSIFAPTYAILIALTVILIFSQDSLSAELEWKSLTSFKDVRRMRLIDDTLYMATSGGLLINDFDNVSSKGIELTNVDGLGTVDITDIMIDSSGQKWITGMGRLLRFSLNSLEPFLFFDQNNDLIKLHTCADDGNSIWVGSELGLVLFSKTIDGGQIQDSYTLFDSLNPSPEVFDIYLDGDTIWLATSAGLAMADKTNPIQLKSPAFWKTYNRARYPELASDNFNRVVKFENQIYAATSSGLYGLDRTTIDTFVIVPMGQTSSFTDLKVENDSLFFYSTAVFGVIKTGDTATLPITGLPTRPSTGATNGTFRWANVSTEGTFQNSSGSFQSFPFTGIPGNVVTDLTVYQNGVITAGFGTKGSARIDNNGVWNAVIIGENTTLAVLDNSGDAWLGTFGNGLWRYQGSTLKNFDQSNTTMRGNNDDPPISYEYIVIYGLDFDTRYLYAACYREYTIHPITIADLNNADNPANWVSMGSGQGINNEFVSCLDVFGSNMAVGTEGIGFYECNLGPDPMDTSDDVCNLFDVSSTGIPSNTIRTVKYSPDGVLWIGTNFGLSRYDFGIERYVDVALPAGIGPDIKTIEFGARGDVWVGSINGAAKIDGVDGSAELFNTFNSGLVSDIVNNIHFDHFSGKVYFATANGISVVSSEIGQPTA